MNTSDTNSGQPEKDVDWPESTKPESEYSTNPNGGGSALVWIVPLILLAALACMGYIYFSSMSQPALVVNEPADDTPRQIGPGGLNAMPSFGNFEMGEFDAEAVEKKFAEITDAMVDVDVEKAPKIVETIDAVTEAIPGMGLDKLSDNAALPVNQFFTGLKTNLNSKLKDVDSAEAKELLDPAFTAMWAKLKEFSFPRKIEMMAK